MDARALILLVTLLKLGSGFFKQRLADRQRRLPLPPEVSDVYDAERYRRYLGYVAEHKKLGLAESAVSLLILMGLLYSGLYGPIERTCGGNPYLILFATFGLFRAAEILPEIAFSWYDTFRIEEKYGLNKMDEKEFARHTALSILSEAVLSLSLLLLFAFVGEHLPQWTDGFSLAPGRVVLLVAGIAALTAAAVLLLSLFSLFILKRQYHFTPFPEGGLKDKIMALQEGSRKKVRILNVYDESRKSTAKNAFLLKSLWHREFGIADNFLTENADRELLAVLSHEIGHLKHRKNALDLLRYAAIGLAFALFALLLRHPSPVLCLTAWTRESFGIAKNNYVLLTEVLGAVLTPAGFAAGLIGNYRSRREEYEADREAVKNGYGEELIATFKRISSDELVNVNPHPVIEFLDYDHPGMANRIRAIRSAAAQAAPQQDAD